LYAFARIQGIRRKALSAIQDSVAETGGSGSGSSLDLGLGAMDASSLLIVSDEEKALAKQLMRLDEVLDEVARDLYPNKVN
jgi:arginyl-tRNA synthetase